MILELREPIYIPQVLELYRDGIGKDANNLEFLLRHGMSSDDHLILLDVEAGIVNAYLYTVMTSWECEPVAFIQNYVPRKGFDTATARIKGMVRMEEWARGRGAKAIMSVTERGVGAFEKRYNFLPVGTVIRKAI